jgi:hypothetical protein
MIEVLYLCGLIVLLVVACAVAVWPSAADHPGGNGAAGRSTAGGASAAAPPRSLEGVLVAQLSRHEISLPQYLRAMERLAARDDERHPLTVPPEMGSAGT